jgi:4-amino-4-deoxy-L-arabinose transferase-like glycosyltransferase
LINGGGFARSFRVRPGGSRHASRPGSGDRRDEGIAADLERAVPQGLAVAGGKALYEMVHPAPFPGLESGRLHIRHSGAARSCLLPPSRPAWRRTIQRYLPSLLILLVQAALALRLVHANTAFEDEALYLRAGHLEWAHWLHGARIPLFPTYFSGAPVVYPPLGALADSAGGLAGARILSMFFMLGATALLWATARRLYGERAAFFAASLWVALGPTQRLSAFATYDPMALFLIALAAWFATGASRRREVTHWMLAGAAAMVLANATKYASALFDPVIIGLAFLTRYPDDRKDAQRRAAYLLAVAVALIIPLLEISTISNGWYLAGIEQTTLMRPDGGTPISMVLHSAWDWTAVVVVLGVVATVVSIRTEPPKGRWLLLLLAGSAVLVPVEQARIHTYTSLSKHVDFGAWFAVIAAGYAADRGLGWVSDRRPQRVLAVTASLLLVPLALAGTAQADKLFVWPGTGNLIPVLRQLTAHGGRILADNDPPLEYYLPRTSWRQWSSVYGITLPSGKRQPMDTEAFGPFRARLAAHYFSVIVLAFTDKPLLDTAIARYLSSDRDYRFVGSIPYSNRGATGGYPVWVYQGGK